MLKFHFFSVADNGGWVLEIFKHPEQYIGKQVHAVSEVISMNDIVAGFEKVTGKKATALQIDRKGMEEWGKQGWFQQELTLNNLYFVDHPECRKVEESKKVWSNFQTWETFLRNNLSKFNV